MKIETTKEAGAMAERVPDGSQAECRQMDAGRRNRTDDPGY